MMTEWNLQDIYNSKEDFEKDLKTLGEKTKQLVSFKGKLAEGADTILACFQQYEQALEIEEKLYAYAMLSYHKDMSCTESMQLYKTVEKMATDFSESTSFIFPELSKIEDATLEIYLQENKTLKKEYEKTIQDVIKEKKHILSKELESALAQYAEVFGASESAYDIFTNTEFDFPSIQDEKGNVLKMSTALYTKYATSKNPSIRKQAFDSMYALYKKHQNTITELYLARVKQQVVTAKLRNYESSLDAATQSDDSNTAVYEMLLKQVNRHLPFNHAYMELKKKLLNMQEMHIYDVYVNPLNVEEKEVPYEEAKQTVLEALQPMGEDYVNMLKYAFEHQWLDVYETENKMSGAYSMGVHTVHPFVLLNYIHSTRDISTIAHELGHSMHSYYASKHQNIINANYTIMVAEVASTVNEILLANYLIQKETDPIKKAALINEQLDTIRATLYRQAMFAEFEKEVHAKVEKGESLTSKNLGDIYYELVKKYFGDAVIVDEDIRYEWARIPHFYSCFYVYKYATGITAAIVIANGILNKKEGYVDKYIEMLSMGGKLDSLELLRMVDVDLEKEETYEEAFQYFKKNLEELKKLLEK